MTKQQIIEKIQATEAALFLELAVYDHAHAPVDCNEEAQIQWDLTDPGHRAKSHAWNIINGLMVELGIDENLDAEEFRIANELYSDLFIRRQAANGIFYN